MTQIAEIDMLNGRVVYLRAFYAQATYAYDLEGAHTSRSNDARIRGFVSKAGQLFGEVPVVLIEPVRRVGPPILGYSDNGGPVHRETLPEACCIAHLESSGVEGSDGCFSALTVVWFQDAPPPIPVGAALVDVLSDVNWDATALSYWP